MVAEKLIQEEIDLQKLNPDSDEIVPYKDLDDEAKKEFIKKIIRYEADHFVISDPHKEDPIFVSDESIDTNMDFFVDAYNEVINMPYLSLLAYLRKIKAARKSLKANDLLLYARREFARVDLGIDDSESYFDLNYDSGDIIDFNAIKKDEAANKENIVKTDSTRLLVEYIIKLRYGGSDMSQVDLIVEKLEDDIRILNAGDDLNKEMNIKDITKAIDIIKCLGLVEENERYMDTKWYKYLIETIVYDERAVKLAKEMESNPKKAKHLIDKIFGPDMVIAFVDKYKRAVDYAAAPSDVFIKSAVSLLFYTMAKKVRSNMKSGSSRSLIYRGYLIHYMLDDIIPANEMEAMTNLYKDLFDLYLSNVKLSKILKNNKFNEIVASSSLA
jgi:hypothetical protein